MRTISKGVIPKEKVYRFQCNNCKCVFEALESECRGIVPMAGNINNAVSICPTCKTIVDTQLYSDK